jgi:hypothetical protein
VESKAIRANPGVLDSVLAVMEDLAIKLLVSVVAGLFVDAIELGLLQQLGKTVGLFLLLLQFIFKFL